MTATMPRPEGRVHLKHSDMYLTLTMAKIARGQFSHGAIEEMQQLVKKPCAKVQEEKKWGVEVPGHNKVMVAIERHRAMVRKNQTWGCFLCHNGSATNPQTP